MKFNRVVLVVISLALMLLALVGCGKDAAQDNQKNLNVVATTTMLTDLVKEIGGDHVDLPCCHPYMPASPDHHGQ